jgi:hypothetical protein
MNTWLIGLLCKLSLVTEEVGDIALVLGTIDGYQKRWRVVPYFAHVFADWIAFELSGIWFQ